MEKDTEKTIKALEAMAQQKLSLFKKDSDMNEAREQLGNAIETMIDARVAAYLKRIFSDDGK